MKKKKNRKSSGFTLIELILVIIVVGLAFPGIFRGLITALFKQTQTQAQSIFVYLAQEKMEQMKGWGFSHVTSATESAVTGFSGYQRQVSVTYVDSSFAVSGSATSYKKVTVQVTKSGFSYSLVTVLRSRS